MSIINQLISAFFLFFLVNGCVEKGQPSKKIQLNVQSNLIDPENFQKINGVSFVASKDSLVLENISPLKEINADHAAIMPFGFIKSLQHPNISYNQKGQWFGETIEGARQYIRLLHKNNVQVMVKPQIWIWNGEFTGFLKMASEEDWLQLENSYSKFILEFAKLSEGENVAVFCIGTELGKFIEHRPEYWRQLIGMVRQVYRGKITYAANWDEYTHVPFWNLVDFIGVDAYFPISDNKAPTISETLEGWKKWKTALKAISEKEKKQILFTEYGYRSVAFTGREPWQSDRGMTDLNIENQSVALEGLYLSVWGEKWFAGGFLWKWFIDHNTVGGLEDTQFTPQNKPAEKIVKKYYTQRN